MSQMLLAKSLKHSDSFIFGRARSRFNTQDALSDRDTSLIPGHGYAGSNCNGNCQIDEILHGFVRFDSSSVVLTLYPELHMYLSMAWSWRGLPVANLLEREIACSSRRFCLHARSKTYQMHVEHVTTITNQTQQTRQIVLP